MNPQGVYADVNGPASRIAKDDAAQPPARSKQRNHLWFQHSSCVS